MLEDRDKGIVYVPVTADLVASQRGWSRPVQFRFVRTHIGREAELELEVRDVKPEVSSSRRIEVKIVGDTTDLERAIERADELVRQFARKHRRPLSRLRRLLRW